MGSRKPVTSPAFHENSIIIFLDAGSMAQITRAHQGSRGNLAFTFRTR
jgi:hypothetical protein